MTKVAINGFGRIGRLTLRAALDKGSELEFVAINDLVDAKTLAHLFKWDSIHGPYCGEVTTEGDFLIIDGKKIRVCSEKDPVSLPWKEMEVDIVVESTGLFRKKEQAARHLEAGAKKVIITAPARGGDVPTFVMGVNETSYDASHHHIVSNASCTTNCLAPMAKVLMDNFGIKRGIMTTIHSYTNDQMLLDGPHKDLRRARAAAMAMVPTTTGAAEAVGKVIPQLNGKLTGIAIRVPTPDVSLVDLVVEVEKDVTCEEVNSAFKKASEDELKEILVYCDQPLVSVDFITNPASSIFDAGSTKVIEKKMVKVFGWYDNEWGYSYRVVDLAEYMAERIS